MYTLLFAHFQPTVSCCYLFPGSPLSTTHSCSLSLSLSAFVCARTRLVDFSWPMRCPVARGRVLGQAKADTRHMREEGKLDLGSGDRGVGCGLSGGLFALLLLSFSQLEMCEYSELLFVTNICRQHSLIITSTSMVCITI